jgi:hypothetical protein
MVKQFWYLAPPNSPPEAEWDPDKMKLEPVTRGGGRKRLSDLHVVLSSGVLKDFNRTWHREWLILDRTLDLLKKHRLSGFITKPVTARFADSDEVPPKLWEVVVIGWGGMASPRSGIRFDEVSSSPEYGFLRYTDLRDAEKLIDVTQWDGSDFFMVWSLPRFVFITKRVARVIREHGLKGAHIKAVTELAQTSGGFSPGRLSDFMPDERARELGEPLGIY